MDNLSKVFITPEEADNIKKIHNVVLPDGSVKVNRTYADVVKACKATENMFETIIPTLSALQMFMKNNPHACIGTINGDYVLHERNPTDKEEKSEDFEMPPPSTLYFSN